MNNTRCKTCGGQTRRIELFSSVVDHCDDCDREQRDSKRTNVDVLLSVDGVKRFHGYAIEGFPNFYTYVVENNKLSYTEPVTLVINDAVRLAGQDHLSLGKTFEVIDFEKLVWMPGHV